MRSRRNKNRELCNYRK